MLVRCLVLRFVSICMVGLLLACCWLVVWFVVDSSFILYGWRRPAPSAVWAQHRSRPAQIGKPRSAMPGLKTAARYGTIGGVPCRRHNRAPALTSSADTCRSAFSPAHGITSTSSGSNDFRRKSFEPPSPLLSPAPNAKTLGTVCASWLGTRPTDILRLVPSRLPLLRTK